MKSQCGLDAVDLKDVVSGILKTVRLPSAQMDVFSFLLQLVADHLLSEDSSDDDKTRLRELLERSKFIQGRLRVPKPARPESALGRPSSKKHLIVGGMTKEFQLHNQ